MKKLLLSILLLLSCNSVSAEEVKSGILVKKHSQSEVDQLLKERLNGGIGSTFAGFANQFLVSSVIQTGCNAVLVSLSNEVSAKQLMSTFPQSYKPTFKELLDCLAQQTSSTWKYNPDDKFIKVEDKEGQKQSKPSEPVDIYIFEFTPSTNEKSFTVELPSGWTSKDMGHWVKYSPPKFPVGLDIYEMGTYSSSDGDSIKLKSIPSDLLLEWGKRIKQNPTKADLKKGKIGTFDADLYECEISGKDDKKLKWHNWTFMNGNKCYFVLSAYPNELENDIYPDVQKILSTFRIK
ncbi:MAG: hypothetical protein KIT34_02075 [Cyanobacteria bacterium TGS_CYA1]|nr:hypothetical protein [Cyanobacteria bacterium TGS_CYA1]